MTLYARAFRGPHRDHHRRRLGAGPRRRHAHRRRRRHRSRCGTVNADCAGRSEGRSRRDAHRAGRCLRRAARGERRRGREPPGRSAGSTSSSARRGSPAPPRRSTSIPLDSWQRVVDVNLNGLFYCCRAVVPQMLANGYGRIVNVASVAGKEGNPNASAYSASKAGVIGLTKSLGKELATRGHHRQRADPGHLREPDPRSAPAEPGRLYALEDPDGPAGRGARKRAAMILLHGERGVQLHHRLDLRHLGGGLTF